MAEIALIGIGFGMIITSPIYQIGKHYYYKKKLESGLKSYEVKIDSLTGTKLRINADELFAFVRHSKYEYPELYNKDKVFRLKPEAVNFGFLDDGLLSIFDFFYKPGHCQIRELAEREFKYLETEISRDNLYKNMEFIFTGPDSERLAALIHTVKKRQFSYKLENPETDLSRQIELIKSEYDGIKFYTT